jgi:Predicted membrane-associated, metal-dependent hydrolase
MDQAKNLWLKMELIWWLVTLILVFVILYPILQNTNDYPFLTLNIIYIVAFVTLSRHLFLLRYTILANAQLVKVAIILLSIPIIAYLISGINFFQTYIDENGMDSFLSKNSAFSQEQIGSFIRNEIILFGVGSVIAAFLLPFRLVLSLWRWKNRGTV